MPRVEKNGQKYLRQRLKFVDAAAEESAVRFEKNIVAVTNRARKMADARMNQGLAPTNPNHGGGIGNKPSHSFAGNRRMGARMENFLRVHAMQEKTRRRRAENLCDADFCHFCGKPRW